MLEAIPTDIFATNFRLQQQNNLVGEVDTSVFREKARLELEEGGHRRSLLPSAHQHVIEQVARSCTPGRPLLPDPGRPATTVAARTWCLPSEARSQQAPEADPETRQLPKRDRPIHESNSGA